MKIHIRTYGCQMNERDSGAARALLVSHGHEIADGESDADVIIVNTCSVRVKAEEKALGKLGLLASPRRRPSGRIVGVMGCMAERLGEEALSKVKGLDFVLGTHRLAELPIVIERAAREASGVVCVGEEGESVDQVFGHDIAGTSAFVNVMQGCNRRCSYCIVPSVRGKEHSRPAAQIVAEVKGLVDSGIHEVTLLGQTVTSYGRTNEVWEGEEPQQAGLREPFPRLLATLSAVHGLQRIRFASSHPSGCTEELARAIKELGPVCEHLHLPVQSGSDRILKMMKRGYKVDDYVAAVKRLQSHVPGIAITTDFIVGFPSETEEDFELTRRLMSEIEFDNAFIFKYSPRPGTSAAGLPDDVSEVEKRRRNAVLLEDQDVLALRINERLVGTVKEVLVEGVSLRNESRWSGRTATNKIVVFDPVPGLKIAQLAEIRVERAMAQSLYGSVIKG